LTQAALYLESLRRLQARQVATRGRRVIPPALLAVRAAPSHAPESTAAAAGLGADRAPSSGPTAPPHETGVFAAVGRSRDWPDPAFWARSDDGLLFLFHLHGFGALATYAAGSKTPSGDAFWAEVVSDWLRRNHRPSLPAWHPYPTSLRLVAWASALGAIPRWPTSLRTALATEIWRQGRYLARSVEHDIGGNHVLKNATALVFAGAAVPGSRLLPVGLRLLRRELPRQFLADGGHEERSTSYHRAVLDDLADVEALLQRSGSDVPAWLPEEQRRAEWWQAAMAGPDGVLPLVNDAWQGPPVRAEAADGIRWLAESGYAVFRSGRDQATFDAGPVSPPHLPPHAHADVLSFVLWDDGRLLVVDPGAYSYTGDGRGWFRSTAAHSTVEVDGADQCLFWGDFRLAYPPAVRTTAPHVHEGVTVMTASHDGYRRLADPVEHERTFVWCPGEGVVVVDRLRARAPHRITSRLRLAPEARVVDPTRAGSFAVTALGGGEARLVRGWYSPYLGVKTGAPALEDARVVGPGEPVGWSLLRSPARVDELSRESVRIARRDGSAVTVPLAPL